MKNLRIRLKLIYGFAIVAALSAAVGLVGIIGVSELTTADADMYNHSVLSINALRLIRENYASQRITYRDFLIYEPDSDAFASALANMQTLESEMDKNIIAYSARISDNAERDTFSAFTAAYNGLFKQYKDLLIEQCANGERESAMEFVKGSFLSVAAGMSENLALCYEYNLQLAEQTVAENGELSRNITTLQIAVVAAAVVVSIFLSMYISGLISKPMILMTDYMKKVAATGDMSLREVDVVSIERCSVIKDEIGICVSSTAAFVNRLLEINRVLEAVSDGDLTVDIELLSDNDTMGVSVKKMIRHLGQMLGDVNNSTLQVSAGSRQIADGSQILAQGATEQAAAVEELSSSISEIASHIRGNADMAASASSLASTIKRDAEKGSVQMKQMLTAVKEIEDAGRSISKVIKVIDDIAFQTNILALNAAVEAARAGQHGKGFAVVAEEVRNLAAKSAEAARDTGGLIANSMEKSELGARIAAETAESLSEIVSGINESGRLVGEIARLSEEQSVGIAQINKGIEQVGQVIQQNSATAEESAAASEEMSQQATLLEKLAGRFKLKNVSSSGLAHSADGVSEGNAPQVRDSVLAGKY